jgi:FkbM family methyltransferase
MKLEDIANYWTLRKQTRNPFSIVRFRKNGKAGDDLRVDYIDRPPLFLRGGTEDYHVFHRINLRDEYRLGTPKGWRCVVDIGGNVGLFAARTALLAERVITCEPVSINFERLQKNCSGYPHVEAHNIAVNGTGESVRIWYPREDRLSGQFSQFADRVRKADTSLDGRYEDVAAKTLDQLFEDCGVEHCDLLKLDVEGAEYEILHATSDETFAKIDRIHAEYHDVGEEDPSTRIDAFLEFLRSKGFASIDVKPHRRYTNHGHVFAHRG